MMTDDDGAKFADAVEQWLVEANYHAAAARLLATAQSVVRDSYATGTRRFKLS
jgi:hypothetical protein